MDGISVFLNQDMSPEQEEYIRQAHRSGFTGIFSSLHIPEDDASKYKERLRTLGTLAKERSMKLMIDISTNALEKAGFSLEEVEELNTLGVTGLRMDDGISNQTIAELTHQIEIGLNASTITADDLQELQELGADFSKIEAWHNYYPRPETGLDAEWFAAKNQWLKQYFRVTAFISGDGERRGPLKRGLPTLEQHRDVHPLFASWELKNQGYCDDCYIGDPRIRACTMQQWQQFSLEKKVILAVHKVSDRCRSMILRPHQNRQDEARDVIRSADARFRAIEAILPENTVTRQVGAVTVDNQKYQRYMGEIQIAKRTLPADEKVNVAAEVCQEDLPLLNLITAGVSFELVEKKETNSLGVNK
ncbi:hypothetical protein NRIC_28250 [Enterococcus florum]|uniref:Outer surface protein n=1 Tax=Enterococcus florum TaxID=2480627 RepID=A0A4P5PE98_9ENTE|nr:MupG family TIM beta-alpha barrel fold protein [Enterococcus florum]GCF94934.1 hypothetical protein NRIC_28250 [Enterococcus florum]